MINLLPPHARKQVQIEYWARVALVWVVLIAVASLIVGSLLVPSLVLVRSQLTVYDGVYQTASDQNEIYEELEKSVDVANDIARQLIASDVEPLFTGFINEINAVAQQSVSLSALNLARSEEGIVESIQVSGSALSRAALVKFRDDLEAHALFESAELPLSNLAKDKDVPFNITILTSNESDQ